MRQPHDRGGWPTDEPIDRTEHEWMDWERHALALVHTLMIKKVMTADELRTGIESLSLDEYESLGYFERWSKGLEALLVDRGIVTKDEIDRAVKTVERRWG